MNAPILPADPNRFRVTLTRAGKGRGRIVKIAIGPVDGAPDGLIAYEGDWIDTIIKRAREYERFDPFGPDVMPLDSSIICAAFDDLGMEWDEPEGEG